MDTQKTMEEKMNELTQKAKTLEISLHTVNNIDEVLEKLEKFALKKEVAKEMAKNQVRTWLPGNVSVRVAYEVWSIDVAELEKKLVKLQKLKNLGIFN